MIVRLYRVIHVTVLPVTTEYNTIVKKMTESELKVYIRDLNWVDTASFNFYFCGMSNEQQNKQ